MEAGVARGGGEGSARSRRRGGRLAAPRPLLKTNPPLTNPLPTRHPLPNRQLHRKGDHQRRPLRERRRRGLRVGAHRLADGAHNHPAAEEPVAAGAGGEGLLRALPAGLHLSGAGERPISSDHEKGWRQGGGRGGICEGGGCVLPLSRAAPPAGAPLLRPSTHPPTLLTPPPTARRPVCAARRSTRPATSGSAPCSTTPCSSAATRRRRR